MIIDVNQNILLRYGGKTVFRTRQIQGDFQIGQGICQRTVKVKNSGFDQISSPFLS
jgi:hypothetical protein